MNITDDYSGLGGGLSGYKKCDNRQLTALRKSVLRTENRKRQKFTFQSTSDHQVCTASGDKLTFTMQCLPQT